MELQKDLFPIKITIRGIGYKYLKISLFSGHGYFVTINQHKIVYRLRYKTSNFEKLEL